MRWNIVFKLIILSLVGVAIGCQSLKRPGTARDGVFGLRKKSDRATDPEELVDPLGQRALDRLIWQDLAPSQIGTTLKSRFGSQDPAEAKQRFEEAEQLYADAVKQLEAQPDGDEHIALFEKAAKKYQLAGSRHRESTLEEEALFFEGESFFFANRYVESNRAYEKLVALYSGTRYLDKAERNRFAIAQYWLKLAEENKGIKFGDSRRPTVNLTGEARRIFHRIRIDDPTGKLADDATMALGMAYFTAGRYYEAADAFEDLRRNYPGSQHQFLAHLYEFKSRLKSYRGGSYDDTPLQKADRLLETIVKQFPDQAAGEKEFLAVEANRIRNMMAERDLSMAKYFENRGENRAAKMYYEQVAQNYGDTQVASEIEEQIAALKDKPPVPAQRGEWLVNMFPDPDSEKPVLTASVKEKLFR